MLLPVKAKNRSGSASGSERGGFKLRVLFARLPDCRYQAHCLEFDIVTEAATLEAAKDDMHDLIAAYLASVAEAEDWEHMMFQAPAEVWDRFNAADHIGEIEFDLPFELKPLGGNGPAFHAPIRGAEVRESKATYA